MPRALGGAVAAILAIAVVAWAQKAPAQLPAPRPQGQQPPARKDSFPRLEVMKVELALLNDLVTFPYFVAASVRGETVELYGFVPSDRIRQHALDVARRSTPLMVQDAMGIQANPSHQPSPRPSSALQKEGTELLQSEFGDPARQVTLETQPNGVAVLSGRIDSVENKLKISRLFRQLSGCCGVVNNLTVEQIVREGRRFVRVTRDGSLLAPPSAVGLKEPIAAAPRPTLLLTNNPSPPKGQWNLPPAVPPKPPSALPKPTPAKIANAPDPFAPSKLPVKWGRPASGWETQANDLEKLQAARKQALTPTPVEIPKRPPEPKKAEILPAAIQPSKASASPRPNFAETPPAPLPVPVPMQEMPSRRSGGFEESEPKIQSPSRDEDVPAKPLPSLRSSRRWPPAYVTGTPLSIGRPGVIVFEDETPQPKGTFAATPASRALAPADLQRRVQSLCGGEAREVTVATQQDGSMLVRVTVANRSIENQLCRKILDLPEMTSPQVRLLMEVRP